MYPRKFIRLCFNVCDLLNLNHTLTKPLKCHQYINISFACVCICICVDVWRPGLTLHLFINCWCILVFEINFRIKSGAHRLGRWLVSEPWRSLCLCFSPAPKLDMQPCVAFTQVLRSKLRSYASMASSYFFLIVLKIKLVVVMVGKLPSSMCGRDKT